MTDRDPTRRAGARCAWIVSAFDWVEDIALAVILLDGPASPWPQIALAAAIPKFAGTGAGLIYAIAGGLRSLARRGPKAQ